MSLNFFSNQSGRVHPVWIGLAVIGLGVFINKWIFWAGVAILTAVFIDACFRYRSLKGD